jgi:hypothetical protein
MCPSVSFGEEKCKIVDEGALLPITKRPSLGLPNPSSDNDCAFYNIAWNFFMYATQSKRGALPTFLSYSTPRDIAGAAIAKDFPPSAAEASGQAGTVALAPRGAKQFSNLPGLNGGFVQAGVAKAVLIDKNRNAIYYGIHLNDTFASFLRDNKINDPKRILGTPGTDDGAISPILEFRTGSLELKSAWQIVEGPIPPNYITVVATIPWLKNEADGTGVSVDDSHPPQKVVLALLGLHVIVAIDDHPEFIWATFEHADVSDLTKLQGFVDVAPAVTENPSPGKAVVLADANRDYTLYEKGLDPTKANDVQSAETIQIDEATQKFSKSTSVYRVFPGSNSKGSTEDEAVSDLNEDFGRMFNDRDPGKADLRRNYRLVGAVWINDPTKNFAEKLFFKDDVLAGEDRLSNMAMESFTQPEADSPNCFSCHHTRSKEIGSGDRSIVGRRINVSHVISLIGASEGGH